MIDLKEYPAEWRSSRNLRWWISKQDEEEMVSCPDDPWVHEAIAVKFAKQYGIDSEFLCKLLDSKLPALGNKSILEYVRNAKAEYGNEPIRDILGLIRRMYD